MKKMNSILEKVAKALASVGDNVRGAHYAASRIK